jgi:hypothetical protein
MNSAIQQVAQVILDDPSLRDRLAAATSVAERTQILSTAGVQLPSQADVSAAFAALTGVSGAGTTTTTPSGKQNHPKQGGNSDGPPDPDELEAGAAAAASVAA